MESAGYPLPSPPLLPSSHSNDFSGHCSSIHQKRPNHRTVSNNQKIKKSENQKNQKIKKSKDQKIVFYSNSRYAGKIWGEDEHIKQTSVFCKLAHNIYAHDLNFTIDGVKLIIDALQYLQKKQNYYILCNISCLLIFDICRYGNLTRFINDPIIDTSQPHSDGNQVAQPNVRTQIIVYDCWPYVFIVAIRGVALLSSILFYFHFIFILFFVKSRVQVPVTSALFLFFLFYLILSYL